MNTWIKYAVVMFAISLPSQQGAHLDENKAQPRNQILALEVPSSPVTLPLTFKISIPLAKTQEFLFFIT